MSSEIELFRISKDKKISADEIKAYLKVIKEMGEPIEGLSQFDDICRKTRDCRLVQLKQGDLSKEVVQVIENRLNESNLTD